MLLQKSIFTPIDQNFSFETSFMNQPNNYFQFDRIHFKENQKINHSTLIKYHKVYGNKWKEISNHLPNTSDSFIKNMFYTLARKALRKINLFIQESSKNKTRKPKVFKLNFVFKLANLAESQRISDAKQDFDSLKGFYTSNITSYPELLYNLLDIGQIDSETIKENINPVQETFQDQSFKKELDGLVQSLRIIQKIFIEQNLIKKGRTKKKFPKKGLVEKAYTSKAFRNSIDESQTMSFTSIQTEHQKQSKKEKNQLQSLQQFEGICELRIFHENNFVIKNQLDHCLEVKTFDPILFE